MPARPSRPPEDQCPLQGLHHEQFIEAIEGPNGRGILAYTLNPMQDMEIQNGGSSQIR